MIVPSLGDELVFSAISVMIAYALSPVAVPLVLVNVSQFTLLEMLQSPSDSIEKALPDAAFDGNNSVLVLDATCTGLFSVHDAVLS